MNLQNCECNVVWNVHVGSFWYWIWIYCMVHCFSQNLWWIVGHSYNVLLLLLCATTCFLCTWEKNHRISSSTYIGSRLHVHCSLGMFHVVACFSLHFRVLEKNHTWFLLVQCTDRSGWQESITEMFSKPFVGRCIKVEKVSLPWYLWKM